ncbi:MAG: MFS transporter, partial [Phycisphaerae bacterium]|nr:MFS transporter [Phycisphaerae bacterium]
FKEMSDDLGLSLMQIGLVWGIGALPGVLTGLVGGSIGDRFGPRRTLSVICILAGVAGALRGLSNSFATLGATIILFSMISPIIPMNVHKTCGIWFSKRQLGLANGVVSMGMALGFMAGSMLSATVLSPWLGGWRNVLFFYGAISIIIGLLWRTTRLAPRDVTGQTDEVANLTFWENLLRFGKIRNVWLLGIFLLGISGCLQGTLGYLPLYLRELGWAEAVADSAAGSFHLASMIFVIPMALWSDRLESRKKLLLIAVLFTIVGVGALPFVSGIFVWGVIILAGFVRDGSMAIFMTMVIETDGVGGAYAGTATGLVISLSSLGALIAPPLGNSLAEVVSPGFPFLFWAVLAAGGWVGLYFVREKDCNFTEL